MTPLAKTNFHLTANSFWALALPACPACVQPRRGAWDTASPSWEEASLPVAFSSYGSSPEED